MFPCAKIFENLPDAPLFERIFRRENRANRRQAKNFKTKPKQIPKRASICVESEMFVFFLQRKAVWLCHGFFGNGWHAGKLFSRCFDEGVSESRKN